MNRKERTRAFVQTIWDWYSRHKRILPWRDLAIPDPTERAYRILVSEIMLQQTQVSRVIIIYKRFLESFPTLRDLAEASNKEVLIAWRGMGYNSRALRLRDAARAIIENGKLRIENIFPTSMDELTSIPGIGHYTAAAIRNFAFGIPTPCIDTNIRRILHRTFVGPENADGTWQRDDQYLLEIAGEVLDDAIKKSKIQNPKSQANPKNQFSNLDLNPACDLGFGSWDFRPAAEWHAALMDFGSLVQTKRNPKWGICPLTMKNIMKTTPKKFSIFHSQFSIQSKRKKQKEPGRIVGSTFIPNRIFRGRIVDALRDAPRGLTLHDIGRRIAIDWSPAEHREWLSGILKQLTREMMLGVKRGRYVLG